MGNLILGKFAREHLHHSTIQEMIVIITSRIGQPRKQKTIPLTSDWKGSDIRRASQHKVQEERRMRANPIFQEIGPHEPGRKLSIGCSLLILFGF